jgi:hypothetical protein
MKKLIFLMALLAFAYTGNAQYIKEGRSMLGANFNYSHRLVQQLDTVHSQPKQMNKNNDISVGLNYGNMISDHVMLGASIGHQNVAGNDEIVYANGNISTQKNTTRLFSAGLFARYYQQINASRFYVFGEGFTNFSLGAGDYKSTFISAGVATDYNYSTLNTTFKVGLTPGIAYFINKTIGLEASLGSISFSNTSNKMFNGKQQTRKTTDGTFNSDLNLRFSSLVIGVMFYFGV